MVDGLITALHVVHEIIIVCVAQACVDGFDEFRDTSNELLVASIWLLKDAFFNEGHAKSLTHLGLLIERRSNQALVGIVPRF